MEVINDKSLALPPLDMTLARTLMARTRVYRLLEGYRDVPPADMWETAIRRLGAEPGTLQMSPGVH